MIEGLEKLNTDQLLELVIRAKIELARRNLPVPGCKSRSRFGRCNLGIHGGTTHAVLISGGTDDLWFIYHTDRGRARGRPLRTPAGSS